MERPAIVIENPSYSSMSDIVDALQTKLDSDLEYIEQQRLAIECPAFLEKVIEDLVLYALEHRLDGNNVHFIKTLITRQNATLSLAQLFGLQTRQINKIARQTCINYLKSLEENEQEHF